MNVSVLKAYKVSGTVRIVIRNAMGLTQEIYEGNNRGQICMLAHDAHFLYACAMAVNFGGSVSIYCKV